ncbi:MAG: glycosyltransferase [Kiritimatiellia bacterium]
MKHVLYVLEAVEGGAWRHLKDLIGEIHGKSVQCSVALSFERDLDNIDEVLRFLSSINVPFYEIPMKRGAVPGDMTATFKISKLIRELKPDLVHAHCAKAGVLGRIAAKLNKTPAVYTPHCFPFLMNNTRLSAAYNFVEKGMVNTSSAIIVLSREEYEASIQLGYHQQRIHFIPNGIRPCGLKLPEINNHKPLKLGFFGRDAMQKGADDFVRMIQELNQRDVECVGNIYGVFSAGHPASGFGNCDNCQNIIRICGRCPQDQVIRRMRECDVIVIPSRWEGLPYVLLEALDAGVPVSAYCVGGIEDVITHGVNAMLAAPGEFDDLVTNTAKLCDAALRREFAEKGRQTVAQYNLERMVAATLDVYNIVRFCRI